LHTHTLSATQSKGRLREIGFSTSINKIEDATQFVAKPKGSGTIEYVIIAMA
jgi:hypothetical protein